MYANPQNGTRNMSPRSGFSPAPAGGRGPEPSTANSTFSIVDLVRRRWKYVLVSGVICITLAVWLGGSFSTKTWTYSTVLLYQPPISGTGSAGLDLPTLRTMVKARSTLEQLISDFKLDLDVIVLDKLIEAEIPPASSSLVLTLKAESPEKAEGMLNRLVEILCANTAAIWRESMDRKCDYSLAELDRAKQSVDRAQRQLAEFAQQTKIVDIAHDLTGLKTVITTLEEKVRDQHHEQLELLTQKAKPAVRCQIVAQVVPRVIHEDASGLKKGMHLHARRETQHAPHLTLRKRPRSAAIDDKRFERPSRQVALLTGERLRNVLRKIDIELHNRLS